MSRFVAVLLCALALYIDVSAQEPVTGFPPFGTFQHGSFDNINLENLNVVFKIPITSRSGRGLGFSTAVSYNSSVYAKAGYYPNFYWYVNNGWQLEGVFPTITVWAQAATCRLGYYPELARYTKMDVREPDGTMHYIPLNVYTEDTLCGYPTGPSCGPATDASGYSGCADQYGENFRAYAPGGLKIPWSGPVVDDNGNSIIVSSASDGYTYHDTLDRSVLQVVKTSGYWDYKYQDASGTYQTTRINFSSFSIRTALNCAGIQDRADQVISLPTTIVLPNNRQYTFEYEQTPDYPGYITGRLQKVTLPSGGSYEYTHLQTSCATGTTRLLTRAIHEDSSTVTWTYSQMVPGVSTLVTAPKMPYDAAANQTAYTWRQPSCPTTTKQLTEQEYQGSRDTGTLLRTVTTDFTCTIQQTPASTVTTIGDRQSKVYTVYDLFTGNLMELREYDWGSGAPGPLLRTTSYSYLSSADYTSRGILNRLIQKRIVEPGQQNPVAETNISYDQTSPACTSNAPQHDYESYGCTFNFRGNPTTVQQLVSGTSYISTTFAYDDLGNLISSTDPGGHTTTFSYNDSFADGINRNTYAYLTKITKPAPFNNQFVTNKYYYGTGQLASTVDENGRETTYSYNDPLSRVKQVDFPDGGQATISYNDTARTVTTSRKRTTTDTITDVRQYNSVGQIAQQQLPGGRKIDTVYDAIGRVWQVSNPYVNGGEPTAGMVETRFDALGRVRFTVAQDGTSAETQYAGNAVKVTDAAGQSRIVESDALGRPTKVCEVTAGNIRSAAESCGIFSFGGTGYLTTYNYSPSQVQSVQGVQTRRATYDGVGRLTATRIIEVNTTQDVTFSYDADGSLLSRTDPRAVVGFEYDALHRVTKKKHGTTVVASYAYDGTQANNAVGRLITECDGDLPCAANKTDYNTYDAMGRVRSVTRTSGTAYTMSYTYDLFGSLTDFTYPSGRKVKYGYDQTTAELITVKDVTDPNESNQFFYVNQANYAELGPLKDVTFGNQVKTSLGWNNLGQLTSILTQQGQNPALMNLSYSYFNDGNIQQITNTLDSLKSEKYTYDALSRLFTAQRGPDNNIQRKYGYDYDRYGNRWEQIVQSGSGYDVPLGFDLGSNHVNVPSFTYDASGNITSINTLAFNAQNLIISAGTSVSYSYDAEQRRVRKTINGTTTDYFYSGTEVVAEKTGSQWTDYIFFGGARIAQQTGSSASTAVYLHADHLGSIRRTTDSSGAAAGSCDYEPFGESQQGCSLAVNFRYTGALWDSETSLYHFMFRQYDPSQGRWMGVDPVAGGNRYAYVLNNPINLVDPLGLAPMMRQLPVVNGLMGGNEWLFGGEFIGPDGIPISCTQDGIPAACGWAMIQNHIVSGLDLLSPWLAGGRGAGEHYYPFIHYNGAYAALLLGLDANNFKPWELRSNVVKLLRAENNCSDWFNTGQGSAADIMSNVPILLGNPTRGPLSPADATTPQGPAGAITVAPDGRFYSNSKSGLPVGGVYKPGSYGARMIILLHELAHKVNLVPPDGPLAEGPLNQSDINTGTVMRHCQSAIDAGSH